MRRLGLLSLFLVLPLLLHAADKKFEKKFSVSSDGLLTLRADLGDVTIKGTTTNEVNIVVNMRGSLGDLDDYEITADQAGNTIEVRGKGKTESWFKFNFDDIDVRYVVEIPGKFSIDASTAGGDVTVNNVSGKIQTETSGGDIILQQLSGEMLVETSGGDIQATEMKGNFRGTTSGGNIIVTSVTGNINVETSGGDIRIKDVGGMVSAQTSGGDITIALSGENKGVKAETSGGDIDVLATRNIQANLDASTSGGSVVCSLPITLAGEIDESRVQGTLNGGGELIQVQTSGGDIRIKAAE